MRILIHDYSGHPFQVQLSRTLASWGHEVLHLYSAAINTPRGMLTRLEDDPDTFDVQPVTIGRVIKKYAFFDRFLCEKEYASKLADVIRRWEPDVVLNSNAPSLVSGQLSQACDSLGARMVTWIQDLYGLAAYRILKRKLPLLGHAVGKYFMRLDRLACQQSDEVVLISDDFRSTLDGWNIQQDKVHVVHNWAPLDDLPLGSRDNDWSAEHKLSESLRFLYSGTLSIRHNPGRLLQLGQLLKRRNDGSELIVISHGEGADWLRKEIVAENVSSIRVLPFQPFEQMADVFASADCLVTLLEREAGTFCVPSKVLSYLCAGRAMLASMPLENLSAQIVTENKAGLVVAPEDETGFLAAAARLMDHPKERQQMGHAARQYAEAHFDISTICSRFEQILTDHSSDLAIPQVSFPTNSTKPKAA